MQSDKSNARDLIFLVPEFHGKLWGGRRLEEDYGYELPDGPVGECWAISAHPNGDCKVAGGEWDGQNLSTLWADHRELFGNAEGDEFPLLIKILDAQDDLSIQVHPDDAYANEHENGSLGKRECWYILDAVPGAKIVVGQRLVEEGRWDDLLNKVPVQAGDFFQVDPGTVHAILGGTLVLETQQSSDVTYRVYDFDRRQPDGSLRELHMCHEGARVRCRDRARGRRCDDAGDHAQLRRGSPVRERRCACDLRPAMAVPVRERGAGVWCGDGWREALRPAQGHALPRACRLRRPAL